MKENISANLYQKSLILSSKILMNVLQEFEMNIFVTMAAYWVPDLSKIKGICGHLWRSIFIIANGASYILYDPTSVIYRFSQPKSGSSTCK